MEELRADLSGHIENGLLLKVYKTHIKVLQNKTIRCSITLSWVDTIAQRHKPCENGETP